MLPNTANLISAARSNVFRSLSAGRCKRTALTCRAEKVSSEKPHIRIKGLAWIVLECASYFQFSGRHAYAQENTATEDKIQDALSSGGVGINNALKDLPVEQQKALSQMYLFLVQVRASFRWQL